MNGKLRDIFRNMALFLPPVRTLYQNALESEETIRTIRLEQQKERLYSTCGEDYFLKLIFGSPFVPELAIDQGFYVDVGAHHPTQDSNTKYFYEHGWSGINIEANPYILPTFEKERPRDINLNYAVTDSTGETPFFLFSDENNQFFGSSSTTSEEFSAKIEQQGTKAKKIKVPSITMSDVLNEYAAGKSIDFLSIDIEGGEEAALRSNDWNKHRPFIIVAEILQFDEKGNYYDGSLIQYLSSVGYRLFSHCLYSYFFYDIQSEKGPLIQSNWGL